MDSNKSHRVLTRRELLKYGVCGGAATVLSGGLSLGGCSGKRKKEKPNVLLISLDTVRRDHCSAFGYDLDTTPNLTQLAKQGTLFDLAYAPSSTTAPSHATMFTSLYPISHGVVKNGVGLSDTYETLAEIFKAQGYQTAAVVSSFVLHSKFGFAQGFSHFDDDFLSSERKTDIKEWEGQEIEGAFDRRGNYVTERAIHWLGNERNGTEPFFMFVHYFDAHNPYDPVEPFRSAFAPKNPSAGAVEKAIGRYDAQIAFVDECMGKLLAEMDRTGLKNNTLIIVVSDHGEGLMQHGFMYHGVHIYEEAVRVPVIFRFPGRIEKGMVLTGPVGLVDLAPTILSLADIDVLNSAFQGQNLAPALYGRSSLEPDRPVYLYRRRYDEAMLGDIKAKGEKFGIRIGRWKYIEGVEEGTKELYDLREDPGEHKNLYADSSKIAISLADHLQQWKHAHLSSTSAPATTNKEDLRKLKSLGYVD
jgi:arylsulfatase A-like enzyme